MSSDFNKLANKINLKYVLTYVCNYSFSIDALLIMIKVPVRQSLYTRSTHDSTKIYTKKSGIKKIISYSVIKDSVKNVYRIFVPNCKVFL